MGRLTGLPFSDFALTPPCFSDLAQAEFLGFISVPGKAVDCRGAGLGTELQGLGPGDVEAE